MTGSDTSSKGTPSEVFAVFLKLGLTSFGGPIAHLGYFRDALVTRRKWLDDSAYADLVALCQFLPGPASSQVGFALGFMRAGWVGALAAFTAFTLPSALILIAFALTATSLSGPIGTGLLHGLKIVAVAIVAQAVWGMARSLCPDKQRASIAVGAVAILACAPGAFGMIGAIVFGALGGLVFCESRQNSLESSHIPLAISRATAGVCLALFAGLMVLLPLIATQNQGLAVFDSFYRAGALVFGGGHVVLPLLQAEVVQSGWITPDQFMAGYGATQAVPGPLFTFAAYLGASLNGITGAVIALLAVFLPGFLILIGVLPFWDQFRATPSAQALMKGANAAVVGILGVALYAPVFTSAIFGLPDFALALGCFVLLVVWKAPPWVAVCIAALGGVCLGVLA